MKEWEPRVSKFERRPKGRTDSWREYRVVLDGMAVGRIGRGERLQLQTEPGHHEVYLRLDWCRSKSLELDLEDGQEVWLGRWPNANSFTLPYWSTVRRKAYMSLEVEDAGLR